ncbi:MAG: ABC transporter ATP-binding protein [Rhodothermales bacterium]
METPSSPVIAIHNLHKGFGEKQVLRGVNLEVEHGTSAVVMGGSGSGKSVLIKHLVQLFQPDEGEVWVFGERMDELEGDPLDKMRLRIGYLFQSGALFDSMDVYENMAFLLRRHTDLKEDAIADRIDETLTWVNLANTKEQYPASLSGGQKKRIGLARSIILQPDIMLYDEPTTGLDPVSVRTVSELIVRLRDERGITSVTITHDLLCAEIITDQAHYLHKGQILESGTLDELQASPSPILRNFFGA